MLLAECQKTQNYMKEKIRPRRFYRKVEGFRESDAISTWETISKFDWLRDFEGFDETGEKIAVCSDPKRLQRFMDQQKDA